MLAKVLMTIAFLSIVVCTLDRGSDLCFWCMLYIIIYIVGLGLFMIWTSNLGGI